jgi:hypothetical protein
MQRHSYKRKSWSMTNTKEKDRIEYVASIKSTIVTNYQIDGYIKKGQAAQYQRTKKTFGNKKIIREHFKQKWKKFRNISQNDGRR